MTKHDEMTKLEKLTLIRMCIQNDLDAIRELNHHLDELFEMERQERQKLELTEIEKDALEAFPL